MTPEDISEDMDLFYHALNYRGASSEQAEFYWRELQACVDRLIEKAKKESNTPLPV